MYFQSFVCVWLNQKNSRIPTTQVKLLFSRIWLFTTPRTGAHQAFLSFAVSWSLLRLMAIESVMPYNHLTLHHPLHYGIDHLVMYTCSFISCVVERGYLLWPVCSLGKIVSLCPASFCTPRSNLPVTAGISWLPTFAFQSSMIKMTSFFGVSSRRSCRSS